MTLRTNGVNCRRPWLSLLPILGLVWSSGAVLGQERPDAQGKPEAEKVYYDSRGKRDPFLTLRTLKKPEAARPIAPPPLTQRPPGLAGLLVGEVTVVGMVGDGKSMVALLRGVDNFTYFARSGSRLYNGYVESLSGDQVGFVRETVDTRGNHHRSKVIKNLYAQEVEVAQGQKEEKANENP